MSQSTIPDPRFNADKGTPLDWTLGTGVFPAGGVIAVPANLARNWFYVQSRDVGGATITYVTASALSGAQTTATIALGAAPAASGQGGVDERTFHTYLPNGAISVNGVAGQQVTVMEA